MWGKEPIALHYPELKALAREQGVEIGIEGTMMSGTPILRLAEELLAPAGITRILGIINGTTNSILTQMERGMSYADALAEAEEKGYAEADPMETGYAILGDLLAFRRERRTESREQ